MFFAVFFGVFELFRGLLFSAFFSCFLVVFWYFWAVFLVFCEGHFSCFFGGFAAVACFLVDFAVLAAKGGAAA